jgi:hypothetical protein
VLSMVANFEDLHLQALAFGCQIKDLMNGQL